MDEEARERIQREAETMDPNPDPGWDKMESVARDPLERASEVDPGQDIPLQDVPESERLDRPVGTETDSY